MIWLADYEAYGNTAKVVWREEQLESVQVTAEELQPIRFQGQFIDQETGLHYNRFRYFDPDLGMFTTRDPIGLMGGLNIFQYAPNPIGWVDPFGLSPCNKPNKIDLTEHRKDHILNRHRAGSGKPEKTEFPASWDDETILEHVSDVATDPRSIQGIGKWDSPYVIGTHDGIGIRVDFYPPSHPRYAGKISTAYPINTPPNPPKL